MGWIALWDKETELFAPRGLRAGADAPDLLGAHEDDLVTRGTLVIETRMPSASRPRALLHYERGGSWPFHLSVQAIPGGGLIFVLNQGGCVIHHAIDSTDTGRQEILRLSYSWDAPARRGQIALEQNNSEVVRLIPLSAPPPLRVGDLRALFREGPHRFTAPDIGFLALSSRIEPVGPMPALVPDTPIATPQGYRPLREIRRGDLVVTPQGEAVPVLARVSRSVPARGMTRPLYIRAPYFGLGQDIFAAPSQRLVLSGSDVEYLFGHEAVLAPAAALTGGHSVLEARSGPVITYAQLLLPKHEPILAAGSVVESLYIGRLHRKADLLAASVLAGYDRARLPDHGRARLPVLRGFEARVLAERRAA